MLVASSAPEAPGNPLRYPLDGMILSSDRSPIGESLAPTPERTPVPFGVGPPLSFATLWSTGNDPSRDLLVHVSALRDEGGGSWRGLSTPCRSTAVSGEETELVGIRVSREFGLRSADLASAPSAEQVLRDLQSLLAGTTVITTARAPFLEWWSSIDAAPAPDVLDLSELADLCLPGALPEEGEGLVTHLINADPPRGSRAFEAAHVRAALGILVARILGQPEATRAVLAHALEACRARLQGEGHARGRDLGTVLAVLERPSRWRDPDRSLQPESYELRDGRLSSAVREYGSLELALDAARPAWSRARSPGGSLPVPRLDEERTLDERDLRQVDEIFEEHLPRHFARTGVDSGYRLGQHGVASVIAEGFGLRELRLVHAPTGTGKTLAYLVPAALWAVRNNVRVGIATYTRVLQEQAMRSDAPMARSMLRVAAGIEELRIAVLKGRENYLCWRALCQQARDSRDPAEELLTWTKLALFALQDEHGDLDRFSNRPPLDGLGSEAMRRAGERILRAARSASGCCTLAVDRSTCGAEAAWRAAERAHLVLTNHALALARRDFFQHVVFDECEHLHEVALSAFSSSLSLRDVAATLGRVSGPDDRNLLSRIARLAPEGSEASEGARLCLSLAEEGQAMLAELAERLRAYKRWRAERVPERNEADLHSLFREFVLESGDGLLATHERMCRVLAELGAGLARLQESLDVALPSREAPRMRRSLELLRGELEEQRSAIQGWIPRDTGGAPAFGPESFHDLETNASGEDVLVTRVLLPHEFLGRHYYPMLAGGVLLSATTWLRGGFESASAYLGLARAADPAPDEERAAVPVASFRAPEAFDYSRVIVAIPRDAPSVSDKQSYLDYVARFIGYLGERTRGRVLGLFTNADDAASVGQRLQGFFAARRLPFWWQRMRGASKEELGRRFRAHVDSILLGLDAFWFGADFPGPTLEYLVIVRLPFGVPDRYHHAQCAAMGTAEQRRAIYLPRALAKFRQGFGRLMRSESDRGCVFVLDKRVLDPRHRVFLRELPLRGSIDPEAVDAPTEERLARLVTGDSDRCLDAALAHMGMKAETRRRGLEASFSGWTPTSGPGPGDT